MLTARSLQKILEAGSRSKWGGPPLTWASDVSHFHVSLTVQGKVTRQRPYKSQFLKRKVSRSGESNLRPSAHQPSALPPGQAGSRAPGEELWRKKMSLAGKSWVELSWLAQGLCWLGEICWSLMLQWERRELPGMNSAAEVPTPYFALLYYF